MNAPRTSTVVGWVWIAAVSALAFSTAAATAAQQHPQQPPPSFLDLLNQLAVDPRYADLRTLLAYIGGVFATVRMLLPPLLKWLEARRESSAVKTPQGYVSYKDLYDKLLPGVLETNEENEALRRDIAEKATQLAIYETLHGPLPPREATAPPLQAPLNNPAGGPEEVVE